MRFMVSLITDGSFGEDASPEEMKQLGMEMGRFMGELQEAGVLSDPGAALGPSSDARTLRYGEDGQVVVIDGPFAESKEQTAGYMVLECKDLDEAIDWVRKMPVGGHPSIEIRSIADRG